MKLSLKNLRHRSDPTRKYSGDELPLRSELFSADQMKERGKTLAGSHRLRKEGAANPLLARLSENDDVLISVSGVLTEVVRAERRIAPAGEWYLENLYLNDVKI